MDRSEFFWQVLDDLMWGDAHSTISAKLTYTEPIKSVYAQQGLIKSFPTYGEIDRWMTVAGYSALGHCFTRGSRTGRGTFWTKYPELFLTCGVTDTKAVGRCVYRRELYLKVKHRIAETPLLSVGEMAVLFGKSINTIRDWDRKGILPMIRTIGGHRRYDLSLMVNFP